MTLEELEGHFAEYFWYSGGTLETDEPRERFLNHALSFFNNKKITFELLCGRTTPLDFMILFAGYVTKEDVFKQVLSKKVSASFILESTEKESISLAIRRFIDLHQKGEQA